MMVLVNDADKSEL